MLGISRHVTSHFPSPSTYPWICPVSLSAVAVDASNANILVTLPCLEVQEMSVWGGVNPRGEITMREAANFTRGEYQYALSSVF